MKRFTLLLILLLSSFAVIANNSIDNNIKWISDEDAYVTTITNAVIYEFPYAVVYYPQRVKKDDKDIIRKVISYENYSQKIIKKPKSYKVRGFANNVADPNYDTYAIEIKGKIYLLPSKYVNDNSIINEVNKNLCFKYNSYTSKINAYIHERDSLKAKYLPICEQEFQHYYKLKQSLPAIIDSLTYKIQAEEDRIHTEWYESLTTSAKNASKKISIDSFFLGAPNTASGCDLTFHYTNKSPNKTIKYLYLSCSFYNAVNDIVSCTARHKRIFDGVDTGPVHPGEKSGGIWDCVIYNWSAKLAKIESILIEYLDGTSTSISASDVNLLLTSPSNNNDIIKKAIEPYTKQLLESKEQLQLSRVRSRIWNKRYMAIKENSFYELSKNDVGSYKSLFRQLYKIEYDREILTEEFEDFKSRNFMK